MGTSSGGYWITTMLDEGPPRASRPLWRSVDVDALPYTAQVLGLAAVYYGAAKLGLSLAFATPSVTAIWPPTGIALAALILFGYRLWPGVALGAFLANSWTGVPIYAVLGITAGNTLEALAGAYLLRGFAGFRDPGCGMRDAGCEDSAIGDAAIRDSRMSDSGSVSSD